MSKEVIPGQDYIDSRDVIKRIEDLQADLEAHEHDPDTYPALEPDELDELKSLKAFDEECSQEFGREWNYGMTLVHTDSFTEHAQQLAEDCGDIRKANEWPYNCIDWDKAAEQLRADYVSVSFGGYIYWGRPCRPFYRGASRCVD